MPLKKIIKTHFKKIYTYYLANEKNHLKWIGRIHVRTLGICTYSWVCMCARMDMHKHLYIRGWKKGMVDFTEFKNKTVSLICCLSFQLSFPNSFTIFSLFCSGHSALPSVHFVGGRWPTPQLWSIYFLWLASSL